ncbi:MAG: carbon storage regulator [Pirellulales bacterium]|nr:carbon storage regulator [Pirellulales bacterium]
MLVLSRKANEKIVLPDLGVTFTILSLHGKRARIGIEAPTHASIQRGELRERLLALLDEDEPQPGRRRRQLVHCASF